MTLTANPLVTIAIPTYNRWHYLKEAVASALGQTHAQIEVLIGDDGDTQAIRRWCEELASDDRRVRYRRNERNLGLAGNWNALVDAARGEFIVIIGDDDRLLPEFVSTLLAAALPGADVAFSNHYLIDGEGERLEERSRQQTREYGRDLLAAGEVRSAEGCVWRNSVPISAALLRAEEVRRLRFKEDLNTPEIELFARWAREGGRFVFTPEYLAEYRIHSDSATTKGLMGERLIKYLEPIKVSPEVEPLKRRFISQILVETINACLRRGDWDGALRYSDSLYYPGPERLRLKSLMQRLCMSLPQTVGLSLYRYSDRSKNAIRHLAKTLLG